jgi:hypothetical protein
VREGVRGLPLFLIGPPTPTQLGAALTESSDAWIAEMLKQHLTQTEQDLETRERIHNQRRHIAELERSGRPTTVARKILETLLQTLAQHERGRLSGDLGYD